MPRWGQSRASLDGDGFDTQAPYDPEGGDLDAQDLEPSARTEYYGGGRLLQRLGPEGSKATPPPAEAFWPSRREASDPFATLPPAAHGVHAVEGAPHSESRPQHVETRSSGFGTCGLGRSRSSGFGTCGLGRSRGRAGPHDEEAGGYGENLGANGDTVRRASGGRGNFALCGLGANGALSPSRLGAAGEEKAQAGFTSFGLGTPIRSVRRWPWSVEEDAADAAQREMDLLEHQNQVHEYGPDGMPIQSKEKSQVKEFPFDLGFPGLLEVIIPLIVVALAVLPYPGGASAFFGVIQITVMTVIMPMIMHILEPYFKLVRDLVFRRKSEKEVLAEFEILEHGQVQQANDWLAGKKQETASQSLVKKDRKVLVHMSRAKLADPNWFPSEHTDLGTVLLFVAPPELNKEEDQIARSNLPSLLFPWVIFTCVLLYFLWWDHNFGQLAAFALLWSLLVASYITSASKGAVWKAFSHFLVAAAFSGYGFAWMLRGEYVSVYNTYKVSPTFDGVDAHDPGEAYLDAGAIQFKKAVVMQHLSVGLVSGKRYCAAPIADDTIGSIKSSMTKYGFWAVGEDCCSNRGNFWCDGTNEPGVQGGLVLLQSDPSVPSEFTEAVKLASAVYNTVIPEKPILMRWTGSKGRDNGQIMALARRAAFIGILLFLMIPLAIAALQLLGMFPRMGQVTDLEAKAMGWEWHAGNAAQQKWGFWSSDEQHTSMSVKKDFVSERVYWSGSFFRDYVFHVCNTHIFIACFAAHPDHPFSKVERSFLAVLFTLMLLWPTAAFHVVLDKYPKWQIIIIPLFIQATIRLKGMLRQSIERVAVEDAEYCAAVTEDGSQIPEDVKIRKQQETRLHQYKVFGLAVLVVLLVCTLCTYVCWKLGTEVLLEIPKPRTLTTILFAFTLELFFDLYRPDFGDANRYELNGVWWLGVYGRWKLERASYLNNPCTFLWRGQLIERNATAQGLKIPTDLSPAPIKQ